MRDDRASATAEIIAASTLLLTHEPSTAGLVAPGASELCQALLSQGARARLLRWSAGCRWTWAIWRMLEQATHPGITRHYWLRKRWIEARAQAALLGGVRRVVVVGAGLDTLALRLARSWPGVVWVEIDHPATQAAKRRALSRAGIAVPPNLRFVAADLARDRDWPHEVGAEPGAVLVVLEGLLMYFDRSDVEQLLVNQLPALAAGPLTVVFSYMVEWPHGRGGFRPASRLVDAWLAAQREPFHWFQPPEALPGWLSGLGYSVVAHASPPFDSRAAPAPLSLTQLQGENLVEAVLRARKR